MHNLIEYSDNYSKNICKFMAIIQRWANDNLADSESFKSKVKIAACTPAGGNTKDI